MIDQKSYEFQKAVEERTKFLISENTKYKKPYMVNFKGFELEIYPYVFNPVLGEGSHLIADNMHVKSDNIVLDMGTGSGALAILAAQKAKRVVAVDCLKIAVECARDNVKRHKFEEKIDVRYGNLFEPIKRNEKFSLILFNPPFMDGEPKNNFEKAIYDKNRLITLNRFLTNVKNYTTSNYRILLSCSSISRCENNNYECYCRKIGYRPVKEIEKKNLNFFLYELNNL